MSLSMLVMVSRRRSNAVRISATADRSPVTAASVAGLAVDEVRVDIVSGYPEPVAGRPPADLGYLLRRVNGTRRVGRRGKQEQLGPLGAGRFEVGDAGQVASTLVGQHRDGDATRQLDRFRI